MSKKIKVMKFKFGEIIVTEGVIPKGLFILKKGQCKVITMNQGERRLFDNRNTQVTAHASLKQKKSTKGAEKIDENIFNDFNPDNSILNQINFMEKKYQNAKILVDN